MSKRVEKFIGGIIWTAAWLGMFLALLLKL